MSELLGTLPQLEQDSFPSLPLSQTTRQRERAESLLSTPAELTPIPY